MAKTLEPGLHIYTPFLELTKEEVIERGCILGVVLISDLKPALNLWRASATPANSRTRYAQNERNLGICRDLLVHEGRHEALRHVQAVR